MGIFFISIQKMMYIENIEIGTVSVPYGDLFYFYCFFR